MWPSNAFQGQANFQQGQGSFQQNYADDSYIPFSPDPSGQQYFQNLRPSQGLQYSDLDNSEQSTPGEFQPEIGLYEEDAFSHNQFHSSTGPDEYVPQPQSIAVQGTPRPMLNARAEELKAQLLKSKERAKSGTPPVSSAMVGSRPSNTTDGKKSLRESPNAQGPSPDEPPALSRRSSAIIEDDLNDLIFQAQAAVNVNKDRKQNGSTPLKPKQSQVMEPSMKFHTHNLEPSKKMSMPGTNGMSSNAKLSRENVNKKESIGDLSDVSEGEIKEDSQPKSKTTQPLIVPKETQSTIRAHKHEEQSLRKSDVENKKSSYNYENRGLSPYRDISSSKSRMTPPRLYGERHEQAEEAFDRRSRQSGDKDERKQPSEPDRKTYLYRDTKNVPEDQLKHQTKYNGAKEEIRPRRPEVPTLAQFLLVDEDLKDWLDVTGYHNAEYRNKILNRRRAIAALDAQKAKLLEEMEIEERGGVPPVKNGQVVAAGMLPPPIPSKMGAAASSIKKTNDTSMRPDSDHLSSTTSNQDLGVKRTYTDYRGSQDDKEYEREFETVGFNGERAHVIGMKIKNETQAEDNHTYSSGPSASRRRSSLDDNHNLRPDERSPHDEDRSRDRERGYERRSRYSPSEEEYNRSPPAKIRKYEFPSPEEREDPRDWKNRPFVMRGNYRGRAYDPNYRGRGRGRGNWNELGEGRFERRDPQASQPHAPRLTFMKPYKDSKSVDWGRKGDTKYFIVKSFNEENVVRCIEDSIWTTQVENGEIFKTAFHKYKNVILVFSVNQSRAFQGYARMENVPGSEEAPRWQNNINWESAGAFKVRWLCVANTRFQRVGHIKNGLNENQPVLVGRDGQEIEEFAGEELLKFIDEEADMLLIRNSKDPVPALWDD